MNLTSCEPGTLSEKWYVSVDYYSIANNAALWSSSKRWYVSLARAISRVILKDGKVFIIVTFHRRVVYSSFFHSRNLALSYPTNICQ